MGRICISFLFFMPALVLAQPRIAASLDTIAMTIGEDIQYQIEVQTDSTAQVIFPQGQTFLPFEIIDTTKVDIQQLADKALWKRTYTLIQFDSGSYHIPRQRVFVDGTLILTDSLKIEVFTVEVDTLKQPLHPIKPIIEIKKNNTGWWRPFLDSLVGFTNSGDTSIIFDGLLSPQLTDPLTKILLLTNPEAPQIIISNSLLSTDIFYLLGVK